MLLTAHRRALACPSPQPLMMLSPSRGRWVTQMTRYFSHKKDDWDTESENPEDEADLSWSVHTETLWVSGGGS